MGLQLVDSTAEVGVCTSALSPHDGAEAGDGPVSEVRLRITKKIAYLYRFPNMRLALEMGRADGMPEAFLNTFLAKSHDADADTLPSEWWEILRVHYVGWRLYAPR